jgi:hypothetical protein
MYQLLKDFAGPVATVIAAGVAVFVTWRLGRGQQRIAEQQAATARQQANTALDQLRYNLFERRYDVYNYAIEVIMFLENAAYKEDVRATDIVPKYFGTLDNARFFFPDDICNFVRALQERCQSLAAAYEDLKRIKDGSSQRASRGKQIVDQTTQLRELRLQMPAHFEKVLQFPQLTRRASSDEACYSKGAPPPSFSMWYKSLVRSLPFWGFSARSKKANSHHGYRRSKGKDSKQN